MKRNVKNEFKELVRISTPNDRFWMSGYLDAVIEEDPDTIELPRITQEKDSSRVLETAQKNIQKTEYMSMAENIQAQPQSQVLQTAIVNPSINISAGNPAQSFTLPKTATIVYGTETGNSKKIASQVQNQLKGLGLKTKVSSTSQYKVDDLSKEELLVTIISTHGDGEPPEAARSFHTALSKLDKNLSHLKFSVLALGDSSYPLFCQTGKDIDQYLSKANAVRIHDLGLCDVDYEETANAWSTSLIESLQSGIKSAVGVGAVMQQATHAQENEANGNYVASNFANGNGNQNGNGNNGISQQSIPQANAPKNKNFYLGKISQSINLTDAKSGKEIRHIEIQSETDIDYLPGDSVGIIPKNDLATVSSILKLLKFSPDQTIQWKGNSIQALDAFENKISIRFLPKRVLTAYENLTLRKLPDERLDLIDLLEEYLPHESIDRQAVVDLLEPITPRYYSISSSPEAHGKNEVHITVADVDINASKRNYKGLCTGFLFQFVEGSSVEFKIQKNNNFRIPESNADIIMIGPGTGIAPFRSFLFEREALGHTGKNWLFFGNRHFSLDFLYQTELLEFFDSGVLSKFNTAFSRDSDKKVYVQDKIRENGKELFEWIESGAILYICGSKDPMSKDVDDTLIEIIHRARQLGKIDAKKYLDNLIETGRYKKDVY
ncbi:diflavin oxidoreductase [Leptospira sp. GIMC2001]|uniref:diflavin oxidoreductase n=1 Tax=Leptospira sp. GIMC2001 TaxID=1513297 RepID=UPI00234A184A|nr:flavodoxin domain-containing protein [Leptospira sp. GIMC2001]WCL50928.1 flavodoxin domain-containing protein [Leptospira sp. GIMC2001]